MSLFYLSSNLRKCPVRPDEVFELLFYQPGGLKRIVQLRNRDLRDRRNRFRSSSLGNKKTQTWTAHQNILIDEFVVCGLDCILRNRELMNQNLNRQHLAPGQVRPGCNLRLDRLCKILGPDRMSW